MIPLFHDLDGERVLVFGGGPVGARRARTFAADARVVVVSPSFLDASFGGAELVRAAPDPLAIDGWIDRVDPALVIAATDDPTVNQAVETAARERGLLRNRADRAQTTGPRSVVVPAVARDDPVVVAVGSGGTSPTLAKYLRDRYEADLAGSGEMADLLGDLRETLSDWPADRRRQALTRVIQSDRVWKALGDGDPNERQLAVEIIDSMGESE